MDNSFATFVELASPILLSLIVFVLVFCIKTPLNGDTRCQLSLFGLVNIETGLRNLWLIRITLLIVSFALCLTPAFKDYSAFFPTHFQMHVFFDDDGIQRSLEQLSYAEANNLNVGNNWRARKAQYLSELSIDIEKRLKQTFPFDGTRGTLHSKGETYFKVTKVKGWQNYQISMASGSLEHLYEGPQQIGQKLFSQFELLESDSNLIQPSLADIYFRHTILLKPTFKQIIRSSPVQEVYHHNLIAVTKVRFFPVAEIGRTIYFVRERANLQLTPIGYALYTPD